MTWDRYAADWAALHGFDPRRAAVPTRGWLFAAYRIGSLLARMRVRPAALTATALMLNVSAPVAAWTGGPWLAMAFVVLAALAGTVDGALAVLTDSGSRIGYLYDSLGNRVAEVCWLAALWLLGAPGWLLVVCGAIAWLYEYTRARVAAVGLTAAGAFTVGRRTGRLAVTVAGLTLAGLSSLVAVSLVAGTVTIAAVVWVFLGGLGLTQLLSGLRVALR